MVDNLSNISKADTEIDLKNLIASLWGEKFRIICFSTLFAMISIVYSLSLSNEYKATVVVFPSDNNLPASSSLGSLASLGGINLGQQTSSESFLALEIMISQEFIENFVRDNKLVAEIAASKGWNKNTKQVVYDEDIYLPESDTWAEEEPSSFAIYDSFIEKLDVSSNIKTGIVSVSIEFFSPELSRDWVTLYIDYINEYMRQRKIKETSLKIKNLGIEVNSTSVSDVKTALNSMIAEQIKLKAVAEASEEYVFITVNSAMLPEKKSKPSRAIIVIVSTLLGGFLSVFYYLVRLVSSPMRKANTV